MAEDYINFLSGHAVPKAMTLSGNQKATRADQTLQQLAKMICTNQWNEQDIPGADLADLKLFRKVKDDLTVNHDNSVILRGNRIVIPSSLQSRAMVLAHEGHQGIVKTKKLLREKVWFPGIEQDLSSILATVMLVRPMVQKNILNLSRCQHCHHSHGILYMLISVEHFQQENTYWSR